jgi:hypothetical protein
MAVTQPAMRRGDSRRAVRAGQNARRAGQDALRSELEEMRRAHLTTRAEIMARIDRLQDRVAAMAEDIGVNCGRADRAGGRAASALREIRAPATEASAMERQIRRRRADVDRLKDDRAGGAVG